MDGRVRQITFGLGRIAAVQRAGQWQVAQRAGLVPAQAEILARLAGQSLRPAEIAAHLAVSAASASDSIKALVAKGLVERRPDPADGRAQRLVLTDAGHRLAGSPQGEATPVEAAVGALSGADQAALLRALTGMVRALQEARAIPVQRMCVTCRHFRPHAHADGALPHHCAFVDAAFGDAHLRLDCGEHEAADPAEAAASWRRFAAA